MGALSGDDSTFITSLYMSDDRYFIRGGLDGCWVKLIVSAGGVCFDEQKN